MVEQVNLNGGRLLREAKVCSTRYKVLCLQMIPLSAVLLSCSAKFYEFYRSFECVSKT